MPPDKEAGQRQAVLELVVLRVGGVVVDAAGHEGLLDGPPSPVHLGARVSHGRVVGRGLGSPFGEVAGEPLLAGLAELQGPASQGGNAPGQSGYFGGYRLIGAGLRRAGLPSYQPP